MRLGFAILAGACALTFGAPARAQDGPATEIDMLIDESDTPEGALRLARSQADDGDLTGAAATLERALLSRSEGETAAVRLYYVAILCRLDDHATAKAELARLDGRGIGDAAWRETAAACPGLARPAPGPGRIREGISGEVATGLAWDSDAANALFVTFDIPGALASDDGVSFTGSAQLDARFGSDGAFFYGQAAAYTKDGLSGPDLDYQIGSVRAGGGYRGAGVEASLGGIVRLANVSGHRYLRETGGEAVLALPLGSYDRIALRAEILDQGYAGSTAFSSRDGTHFDLSLGVQGRRDETLDFYAGAAWERKTAETRFLGYSGVRGYFGMRDEFDASGAYATLFTTLRRIRYVEDPAVRDTRETRYFVRGALGVPIAASGVAVEAAGSFTRRDYNPASPFRDYDSLGAELRLVWTFGN